MVGDEDGGGGREGFDVVGGEFVEEGGEVEGLRGGGEGVGGGGEEGAEVGEGGGGGEVREGMAEGGGEGGEEGVLRVGGGGEGGGGGGGEGGEGEGGGGGGEGGEEGFGGGDEVGEGGVGLVEFAGGEFGVVGGVEAFVAEGGAELEDAVEAADDEALEPEFGRDAQREGVGWGGGEGGGDGAAGGRGEDGGLDFEERAGVEEVAEVADQVRAQAEGVGGARVHEHVDVAAADARVFVLEADGEGHEGGGEELGEVGAEDGQLAGRGAGGLAGDGCGTSVSSAGGQEAVAGSDNIQTMSPRFRSLEVCLKASCVISLAGSSLAKSIMAWRLEKSLLRARNMSLELGVRTKRTRPRTTTSSSMTWPSSTCPYFSRKSGREMDVPSFCIRGYWSASALTSSSYRAAW